VGLLFAALATACGIVVHLIAEFAGLGWRADAQLIFSARHLAIALLGTCSVMTLVGLAVSMARGPGRRERLAAIARALPDGGCGPRFLAIAFAAQLFVFAVTQAGEGVPIHAGDLGAATIAALFASALGALFGVRFGCRLIEALGTLFIVLLALASPHAAASWKRLAARVRIRRARRIVFAGSRRPPPGTAVITSISSAHRSQESLRVFVSCAQARVHLR
jgi:hypothetical protein